MSTKVRDWRRVFYHHRHRDSRRKENKRLLGCLPIGLPALSAAESLRLSSQSGRRGGKGKKRGVTCEEGKQRRCAKREREATRRVSRKVIKREYFDYTQLRIVGVSFDHLIQNRERERRKIRCGEGTKESRQTFLPLSSL